MKKGQLKVRWEIPWQLPQIPGKSFEKKVNNLLEAKILLDALKDYENFQYINKIKPNYLKVGGLVVWDENLDFDKTRGKWSAWVDGKTGFGIEKFTYEELKSIVLDKNTD